MRVSGSKSTNPIAVGDRVEYTEENPDTGVIINILDRKNYIIRKASNWSRQSHVIAANIDQVFLVVTLVYPETSTLFIDRFLVTAEAYRIPASLVFNKADLYREEEITDFLQYLTDLYEKAGYPCFHVSALHDYNINELSSAVKGKISLFSGNSGVGKSTLLNKLIPGLNLKTAGISEYHQKGKHITTFTEMFELPGDGYVIDTPGVKGFGLINMDKEEIYHFFPEIFNAAKDCRYHNCLHTHEPGCAVKQSVLDRNISESRYLNYLSILEDNEEKYRK